MRAVASRSAGEAVEREAATETPLADGPHVLRTEPAAREPLLEVLDGERKVHPGPASGREVESDSADQVLPPEEANPIMSQPFRAYNRAT